VDVKQFAKERLVGLGYGEGLDDGLLDYLVEDVKRQILNFTHLDEIPDGLIYTWTDMVAGEYLRATLLSEGSPGSEAATVSSITEGDTTGDCSSSRWGRESLSA
jgi:hypothetical protein